MLRRLRDQQGEALDDALVLRFDGPASATGEDLVELHCHGGRAVVDAVCRALATIEGLREAAPGEFTRRAFENGRIDLTAAEGLADLLEAETETQRKAALRLAEGGLRAEVERWRTKVVSLSAAAEALIDYVDEDESFDGVEAMANSAAELAAELDGWLAQPRAETLKDGVRVVIAGPPNAGKSSLLNALVGRERAIVSDLAGTTRDLVEVPLALGGVPLVLTDTAGLRSGSDPIERIGVQLAQREVGAADILLWLGEPVDAPEHPCCMLVHARCDLPERERIPEGSLGVSVVTGQGLDDLRSLLLERACNVLPGEDRISLNRRQAEAVRRAADALRTASGSDIVLLAEACRHARLALDEVTGRAGMEEVLDALFDRFCLGK